ncbi:bifunctional 5,10-methylenetetrahydrofolate dehydrogenase/5,10-methenyltetrahydrofolate cyclohydrolase [Candidatus Dojkabacteria bacterium]|nr:bifunctional 5,10-methylenetetrahydrofolate dehydrogenase/5,10-methenyltetrahydrofolate cyclohydrolase [Candidatus Dojkabacteria bacterium]
MLLDGNKEAQKILSDIKIKIEKDRVKPNLAITRTQQTPPQITFTNSKKKTAEELGLECSIIDAGNNYSTEQLMELITKISKEYNGILVQMPFPEGIDRYKVLNTVPYEKDVEGLGRCRMGELEQKVTEIYSPVAKAAFHAIKIGLDGKSLEGKTATIVGNSYLLGRPLTQVLGHLGASVSVCDIYTEDLGAYTKNADIVISGTGQIDLIQPEMVKEGVIAIDTGYEVDSEGKRRGDMSQEISEKASLFTPVPGGIGPLTVAFIFDNLLKL